jgi:hypothetical protein
MTSARQMSFTPFSQSPLTPFNFSPYLSPSVSVQINYSVPSSMTPSYTAPVAGGYLDHTGHPLPTHIPLTDPSYLPPLASGNNYYPVYSTPVTPVGSANSLNLSGSGGTGGTGGNGSSYPTYYPVSIASNTGSTGYTGRTSGPGGFSYQSYSTGGTGGTGGSGGFSYQLCPSCPSGGIGSGFGTTQREVWTTSSTNRSINKLDSTSSPGSIVETCTVKVAASSKKRNPWLVSGNEVFADSEVNTPRQPDTSSGEDEKDVAESTWSVVADTANPVNPLQTTTRTLELSPAPSPARSMKSPPKQSRTPVTCGVECPCNNNPNHPFQFPQASIDYMKSLMSQSE